MTVYFVEVQVAETGDTVKRMGPMSERKAEKVERGLEINLNHDKYFVRVVEEVR